MKKPRVWCPACKEIYHKVTSDDYVCICSIIYEQFEQGHSNYPNYTVEPSHCEKGKYTFCDLWREEKEKDWARNIGSKYSSIEQAEQIRI